MIDLKKEREAFEGMSSHEMLKGIEYHINSDSYQPKEPILRLSVLENAVELNYAWLRWKARAELAQAEINDLKQQLSEAHASRIEFVEYHRHIEHIVANAEKSYESNY